MVPSWPRTGNGPGTGYYGVVTDLWSQQRQARVRAVEPLAVRMRPRNLEEFIGQEHLLGPGKLLRRMLEADRITSVIFYGPPGTGKTTLAHIIAQRTRRHFEQANAAGVGVAEVRRVLAEARNRLEISGQRTIFFLDEIHRFSRAQQDVLMEDVERGMITLIGATTENPFFAINSPLLSRSQIFRFEPLSEAQVALAVRRALADEERGYGKLSIRIDDAAVEHWAKISDGDVRRALTALEIAVLSGGQTGPGHQAPAPAPFPASEPATIVITLDVAEQSIQQKAVVYDATGDEHYDAISAFIKSMRGSDPDAAIYWLARMLVAGEDPLFIARRIAILASEDIGNADPRALQVAAATYQVVERIGMPEAQLTLAQAAVYMATAPKSNASAAAIWAATDDVKNNRTLPVPKHLRDSHYRGARRLGHGDGYQYAHDSATGYVDQDYLGVQKKYYEPTDRGYEQRIGQFLAWIAQQRKAGDVEELKEKP